MVARRLLMSGAALAGAAALAARWGIPATADDAAAGEVFPVSLSDAAWRQRLTASQFEVLRQSGTERPYTSPLLMEHRQGTFSCAGCENAAFRSETKFDSGTGWPSFYAPIAGAVGEVADRSFGMARTAVHCSRCGGHFGHVFRDGPAPTGLRYCMNGVALTFTPAS